MPKFKVKDSQINPVPEKLPYADPHEEYLTASRAAVQMTQDLLVQDDPFSYKIPENDHFGKKFDQDKARFDLIDPKFEEEIAQVLEFGARKYAPNSWQEVPDAFNRYTAAMRRHLCAIQKGELIDADSGLPHHAHMACNAMFISYFTRLLE